jgi:hypothetical protein
MIRQGSGCEQELVINKAPSSVFINNTSGGTIIQDTQINSPGEYIFITSNGIQISW